jgi:hypothetical protein
LLDESLAFFARHRGKWPILHSSGTLLEPLDHLVDIKLSHTEGR